MLYYGKKSNFLNQNDNQNAISDKYNLEALPERTVGPLENDNLHNTELNSTFKIFNEIFKNRKELYYDILEDNFEKLSVDDKLNLIYEMYTRKTNSIINYILLVLILLILILIKLHSN
tara:strand:+ start:4144 stop:4497 length:354 start_codon:yes stop_codon:yes gene_type:complete